MPFDGHRGVPFEPLRLTRDQQQQCQDLTFQLLDRTLRNYDEREDSVDSHSGAPKLHADLESGRWKQLKTQADASLYVERTCSTWCDLNAPSDNRVKPSVLMAAGTIDGTLEEVMFGLEAPDFPAMQVRSEALARHPLHGAVLAQLEGPTNVNPFRSMGVVWVVGERSWPLNLIVHPRDFVAVSATDIMTRANGERIGYEVVQSIDLPQCPLPPKPTVRGKLMYATIFKEREQGGVDVYIQMYLETQCHLFDKLSVATIWDSALGFWDAPRLSEDKKLQWCMDNKSDARWQKALELAHKRNPAKAKHCRTCLNARNALSRHSSAHLSNHKTCALCTAQVCWSCRVKRTLKVPGEHGGKLLDLHVVLCPACLWFVQQQQPVEISLLNKMQREERNTSKSSRRRFTYDCEWGVPTFSPDTRKRYPSISVSDLVRLMNSLSDIGIKQVYAAPRAVRRKTDPLH
ncbi:hypothetical protein KRP22_006574 [Phytophthora ramorum]|uniref:uncharacterized protein n=1 Tax=Phytophthora ramorum TaxID=164328 RepID=UPI0030B59E7C|nr:hypothetical protein KRP23_4474 [Phytophthora ramorum]KAH7507194.1 hypothetical protein KRP22_2298 [Phytophthora ramorum]